MAVAPGERPHAGDPAGRPRRPARLVPRRRDAARRDVRTSRCERHDKRIRGRPRLQRTSGTRPPRGAAGRRLPRLDGGRGRRCQFRRHRHLLLGRDRWRSDPVRLCGHVRRRGGERQLPARRDVVSVPVRAPRPPPRRRPDKRRHRAPYHADRARRLLVDARYPSAVVAGNVETVNRSRTSC